MHIGWNRIWKVLLGCVCVIGSIVLLACGQVGWGIAALEAAVLLLALQYAPRAARLRKTWWFVELVLVLAVTVGYAGFAAVRAAQTPASAVVITTERSVPPVTPAPETVAPGPTAAPPTPPPHRSRRPHPTRRRRPVSPAARQRNTTGRRASTPPRSRTRTS